MLIKDISGFCPSCGFEVMEPLRLPYSACLGVQ